MLKVTSEHAQHLCNVSWVTEMTLPHVTQPAKQPGLHTVLLILAVG